jgi:Holliday junction resolvase RusA-like endonuclease
MKDFVIAGIPRTPQTKNSKRKSAWKAKVAEAARKVKDKDDLLIALPFSAAIIYFYTENTELDVDGIGKLVLDSIKGILIEDDRFAEQVLLRKTNQDGLELVNPPLVLAEMLGAESSFVYVKLGMAPNHQELPQ